jgi:hypothetical protein
MHAILTTDGWVIGPASNTLEMIEKLFLSGEEQ